MGLHPPKPDDHPHDLGIASVGLRLGVNIANVVRDSLFFFLETLDPFNEQPQLVGRDGAIRHDSLHDFQIRPRV